MRSVPKSHLEKGGAREARLTGGTRSRSAPAATFLRAPLLWTSSFPLELTLGFPAQPYQSLENTETGAQGETAHFHPSYHLCSHREWRRDEATPARQGGKRVGPNRGAPRLPQDQVFGSQFTLTPCLILVSEDRLV